MTNVSMPRALVPATCRSVPATCRSVEAEVGQLEVISAGPVNIRRDLYRFIRYVMEKGLVRTVRGNGIPKTDARKLAKLLSYTDEAEAIEEDGLGFWSDRISDLARWMGLIAYDTEGIYRGYTSSEPSFPDNEIKIQNKEWRKYLGQSALEKEASILDAFVRNVGNEFFVEATLIGSETFSSFGCATGPAGKMKLPEIRRGLLQFLTEFEAGRWYDFRDVVTLLSARSPHLILDPGAREPDEASRRRLRDWEYQEKKIRGSKPPMELEDIYVNFIERDGKDKWGQGKGRQITSGTPDAFHRVEGRYLESFLSEIPYVCGFAALAYRKESDKHGLDISPAFERLRAFRLTPRFFQIMNRDKTFNQIKTTVLPNFDVIVEAASYPESTLERLAPYTTTINGDGPVHRLRIERALVVEATASDAKLKPLIEVLKELSDTPLPINVAAEAASWTARGEKVILYEGFGLLEFRDDSKERPSAARDEVKRDLGDLIVSMSNDEDDRLEGFLLLRRPEAAFQRLEEKLRIPIRWKHPPHELREASGKNQKNQDKGISKTSKKHPEVEPPRKVTLASEDLVGYRISDAGLLAALEEALRGKAPTCVIAPGNLLVVSASALSKVRAELKKLSTRFEVTDTQN